MLEVQNRAKSSPDQPSSSTVSITVLSVTPMRPQKLRVRLYRNRHRRRADRRSRNSRDARRLRGGSDRAAQVSRWRWCVANGDYLAEEIYTPIARAVLDKLVERGLIAKCSGRGCEGRMSRETAWVCTWKREQRVIRPGSPLRREEEETASRSALRRQEQIYRIRRIAG